jgi:hypothetical protein
LSGDHDARRRDRRFQKLCYEPLGPQELLSERWTKMSRTNPFWSTAHHSQCVSPAIGGVRTATRRFSQFALYQRVADDLEVLIRAVGLKAA